MATILRPDDLTVGTLLTVHRGSMREQLFPCFDGVHCVPVEDCTYNGYPLVVQAVSLPYVVTQFCGRPNKLIIDTRTTTLCRVSPEYAAAVAGPQAAAQDGGGCKFPWTDFPPSTEAAQ